MNMKVLVAYNDGSTAEFHCDDFGHTNHDSWVVLTRDKDPYVLLSRDNVQSITFVEPEGMN